MPLRSDPPRSKHILGDRPDGRDQTDSAVSEEMLHALKSGDHRSFEQIYYHFGNSIMNFLRALMRSDEIANDITQETFITLWEKRERVDPARNIKTYLYTIARNNAISYFNREKLLDKYTAQSGVLDAESDSSEELLIAKETDLLIRIAVSRMPRLRRRVFELSRYEGWSHDRIAEELHISKSNVSDHLYQATKDIREVIVLFLALAIGL